MAGFQVITYGRFWVFTEAGESAELVGLSVGAAIGLGLSCFYSFGNHGALYSFVGVPAAIVGVFFLVFSFMETL